MISKISLKLYESMDKVFYNQTGFHINEVSFTKILVYMYRPSDPSSLAVTRILFGLAMLFDIPDERGGSQLVKRWGDPRMCHFPLFHFVRAMPMPYMVLVYTAMWLGAMGIMLGYKFRASATIFTICYWYLFVIEKSFWNNHSYLFGLVALLLVGTSAHHYFLIQGQCQGRGQDLERDRDGIQSGIGIGTGSGIKIDRTRSWYEVVARSLTYTKHKSYNYRSIDACLNSSLHNTPVPYWNYFILKYQFFILYFVAGLKKGTAEWLSGYSLLNLSEHWVFDPFKFFLNVSQIDYLIVHWFAFIFDLTVAFWMMWTRTRNVAMIFCAAFHLMNIRLFKIGMFPWVCLATMPLFYPSYWPKTVAVYIHDRVIVMKKYCKTLVCNYNHKQKDDATDEILSEDVFMETSDQQEQVDVLTEEVEDNETSALEEKHKKILLNEESKRKWTLWLLIMYVLLQAFLPYSHFITKGYNNWTNGLYGYSWDMMVHTWNSVSITVRVVDNTRNKDYFLDPTAWTPNDRWARHGDMVYQFARCVEQNIHSDAQNVNDEKLWINNNHKRISRNISVFIDVWCSMNERFQQRMFDPKVDLLQAEWSPFHEVKWLMPLLVDAENWRHTMHEIRNDVHSWSDESEVLFVADFPGYYLENYIPTDVDNVTLTILEGIVGFEDEQALQSNLMQTGDKIRIANGAFHKVHVLSKKPSYYMYTYLNTSLSNVNENRIKEKLPVGQEFTGRLVNMVKFFNLIVDTLYQMFFRMPVSIKYVEVTKYM